MEWLPEVRRVIHATRFRFDSEARLQEGLALAFGGANIPFEREVALAPGDIIDFLLPTGLGIEVKVGGSLAAVTRQLHRYAGSDRVTRLALVTSKSALSVVPPKLLGKPVHPITIRGGLI